MNSPGILVYKCRRCNKLNENTHVPEGLVALVALVAAIHGINLPKSQGGLPVSMTDICCCDDGGMGVTDLIGFIPDKKD